MAEYKVLFLPDNKAVYITSEDTLLEAARTAGIPVKSNCGGAGVCGRCQVIVKEGSVRQSQQADLSTEELAQGYVLACQSTPESDLTVEIPESSRLKEHKVLLDEKDSRGPVEGKHYNGGHALFRKVYVKLEPPTLDDHRDDLSRLITGLRKVTGRENFQVRLEILKKMAAVLREQNWEAIVSLADFGKTVEIFDVEPGRAGRKFYGLAIDIGTTTDVVQLVDLASGEVVGVKGTYNKQAVYGDDVISRIVYTDDNTDGLQTLQNAVINTLNELIDGLTAEHGMAPDDIKVAVCAGNTTMTHLFLGLRPKHIRLEPYVPTVNSLPPVRAQELKLHIHPDAWIHCLPSISSYVGGDITAGTLVTGMAKEEQITLLIDIGTNGEMVLGNQDWLVSVSCSAGPAFEGGGINFGMRAMEGAIERLEITPDFEVKVQTIGNAKPRGICGSGLIDALATFREVGLIDRSGKFVKGLNTPRLREGEEGKEFVLVWADEAYNNEDITLSEADMKTLIWSKGAVFAGIQVMLKMVQLPVEAIDKILIAGGFGNYLNIEDAITIGLLPDLPREKYKFIGNSSLKGANMALLDHRSRLEVEEIAQKMTYLELSVGNAFMDAYVSSLFLPHTDLSLFPTIRSNNVQKIL